MTDGRKRTSVYAAVLIALIGLGLSAAIPANARPRIVTAQQQVDRLFHQAEVASERYNNARLRLAASRTQLTALRSDLARQQRSVNTMRHDVATLMVAQYQGQELSTAGQVVLSNDPGKFIANLSALSAYDNQRGQVLARFSAQLGQLRLRQAAVSDEVRQLAAAKRSLGKDKADIDRLAAAAKAQLKKLKAAQAAQAAQAARAAEAARASRSASPPVAAVPATPATAAAPTSGRAAAAVSFAMAQVGKAYVYGAAGPSAYDCSGLTMAAWGQAGVGLPHSAAAQMGMGAPVSESQLQPGDLVFYYSPVSHVGMYIGNGMIVSAENPSTGVKVAGLHTMPYTGAVRPG
ncbi:MAG: NlpC/P60 family protein [Actinomycetota bacterium]|nr:NlpC/P60 family protein [Actinomycetota bacterium]